MSRRNVIEVKAPELKGIIKKAVGEAVKALPNNVLSEVLTMDRVNLDEMVYTTVPAQKVVNYLKSGFNFAEYNQFDADRNYGIVTLKCPDKDTEVIHLWIRPEDEEKVKKLMGKMGWFGLGRFSSDYFKTSGEKTNGLLGMQFEKKFDKDETENVMANRYIYHYTTTEMYKKIKHIGLVPKMTSWDLFGGKGKEYTDTLYKNTNDDINHGRIYFFTNEGFIEPEFYFKGKNSLAGGKEYVLLKVDTEKLPKGIKFYKDPKQYGAVFTYDNIPPKAIEKVDNG